MTGFQMLRDYDTRIGRFVTPSLIVLILIGVTALRYLGLFTSEMEMGFDEAQYWTWSLDLDWGYFSKPPLLAWMIALQNTTCGTDEFCARVYVPITHFLTSLVIFAIGRHLFDRTVGLLSALMFILLPGISFSSRLITTDVPLLLFWAISLYAFLMLRAGRSALIWGLVMGVAIGLGLLAKYAMIYFLLCAVVYAIATQDGRETLFSKGFGTAVIAALIVLGPNILWNIDNGLITFVHTADNIEGSGGLLNFDEAAEFIGAQFGVFGPITLVVFALAIWRWFSPRSLGGDVDGDSPALRLLIAFSAPVLLLIIGQALFSRAHANWAAPTYVAATVLVTALLVRWSAWRVLVVTLALHAGIQGLIFIGDANARTLKLPGGIDLYYRALGFKDMALKVDTVYRAGDYGAVLTDWRRTTGTLLYNLRDNPPPIVTWPAKPRPTDHFQMSRPMTPETTGPFLYITKCNNADRLNAAFDNWKLIEVISSPAGPKYQWVFMLIEVNGPRFGEALPPPDCDRFPAGERIVPIEELPRERLSG